MSKKEVWYWWWGIDQKNLSLHSPKKKFINFDVMKWYSGAHSSEHQWLRPGYWSNYEKKEEDE